MSVCLSVSEKVEERKRRLITETHKKYTHIEGVERNFKLDYLQCRNEMTVVVWYFLQNDQKFDHPFLQNMQPAKKQHLLLDSSSFIIIG